MQTITYNIKSEPVKQLITRDKHLNDLFSSIGPYTFTRRDDHFSSLSRIIIGQQLSFAAANTIWERLCHACTIITPGNIYAANTHDLRKAGLSNAKTDYLKSFAFNVLNNTVRLERLGELTNEEVVYELTKIKGVGLWTAEIFLIFSLGRLNVFPMQDIGLKRAIKWVYDLNDYPDLQFLAQLNLSWSPYQSIVALYLWEAVNLGLVKESTILSISDK